MQLFYVLILLTYGVLRIKARSLQSNAYPFNSDNYGWLNKNYLIGSDFPAPVQSQYSKPLAQETNSDDESYLQHLHQKLIKQNELDQQLDSILDEITPNQENYNRLANLRPDVAALVYGLQQNNNKQKEIETIQHQIESIQDKGEPEEFIEQTSSYAQNPDLNIERSPSRYSFLNKIRHNGGLDLNQLNNQNQNEFSKYHLNKDLDDEDKESVFNENEPSIVQPIYSESVASKLNNYPEKNGAFNKEFEKLSSFLMTKKNELEDSVNNEPVISTYQSKNPSNYTTELKKVVITAQNGQEIKRIESYKKSLQMIKNDSKINERSNLNKVGDDNLYLVNQPSDSNYGKTINDASMKGPVALSLKNVANSNESNFHRKISSFSDVYFIALVVACSTVSIFSVIGAGYCFYRFQQHNKATADVDYPAYGVIGPATKAVITTATAASPSKKPNTENSDDKAAQTLNPNEDNNLAVSGDRNLAQSAQMYHYHHQKQQMIASENNKNSRNISTSDVESEDENEEGDYTVYECPGLASTGEIEVTNPMFQHKNLPQTKGEEKK